MSETQLQLHQSETTSNRKNIVKILETPLSLETVYREVGAPEAGAISVFVGTTRDHFNDKRVIRLHYEAYVPMAEKEMTKICSLIRQKWKVVHIAIYHRIGEVPVSEASVIIAVSSVHRKESLEAVQFAIDELKASVPIWKKEYYADGSIWKENQEFRQRHQCEKTENR
jgi:molybdopterin synthase catalytic subunit